MNWTDITQLFKKLGPAGPLALIATSVPVVVAAAIVGFMPWLGAWLRSHPLAGPGTFMTAYVVLGALGCLPTHAYSLLAGYAFGFWPGFIMAMVSYVLAAELAYIIARRATGERVLNLVSENVKWKAVYDALLSSGFGRTLLIVTLLRVSPNPFALTNLVMAATRVNPVAYLIATVVGLAPRTGALIFLASRFGLDRKEPIWLWAIWILATLLMLAIIGHVANQAVARVTDPQRKSD